jgi:putative flippase GtrA
VNQAGMISPVTQSQFIKFVLIGLASNLILYASYLLMTTAGFGHKTAMSLLYAVGMLQNFAFNWRWTFGYQGKIYGPLFRYLTTYGMGYLFNLLMLLIFVDTLSLPHQVVQGVLILIMAGLLFLLQKYWIFSKSSQLSLTQVSIE